MISFKRILKSVCFEKKLKSKFWNMLKCNDTESSHIESEKNGAERSEPSSRLSQPIVFSKHLSSCSRGAPCSGTSMLTSWTAWWTYFATSTYSPATHLQARRTLISLTCLIVVGRLASVDMNFDFPWSVIGYFLDGCVVEPAPELY
jgi:hypothetical protein